MRHALLFGLAASLTGCCPLFAPEADEAPPPTSATTATQPATPTAQCPTVEQAILGTWEREGFVEEYGPGGRYVINGNVGTIRWLASGRAFLDVGTLHAEYHLGLTDVNELIAVDPSHIGSVYRRTSPPPSIPSSCYALRQRIVGTWVGGTYTEVYNADGSYRVNALTGTWRETSNGRLHIETQAGVGDYWWAMLSPTSAVAFGANMQGTIYTRQ